MATPGSLLSSLASTSVCAGLTPEEVESLFLIAEVRNFAPGTLLFREGSPADALFVLLGGDVEISQEGAVLAEVGPGAVLGEMSLFRTVATRSATVMAICPVTAVRISGPQFRKKLAARDLAALTVVRNVAMQMADRVSALNARVMGKGKGLTVARSALRRVVSAG